MGASKKVDWQLKTNLVLDDLVVLGYPEEFVESVGEYCSVAPEVLLTGSFHRNTSLAYDCWVPLQHGTRAGGKLDCEMWEWLNAPPSTDRRVGALPPPPQFWWRFNLVAACMEFFPINVHPPRSPRPIHSPFTGFQTLAQMCLTHYSSSCRYATVIAGSTTLLFFVVMVLFHESTLFSTDGSMDSYNRRCARIPVWVPTEGSHHHFPMQFQRNFQSNEH